MQAAKIVKISYSTAKKVFTKFRHDIRETARSKAAAKLSKIQASYREASSPAQAVIDIVATTAGIGAVDAETDCLPQAGNDC